MSKGDRLCSSGAISASWFRNAHSGCAVPSETNRNTLERRDKAISSRGNLSSSHAISIKTKSCRRIVLKSFRRLPPVRGHIAPGFPGRRAVGCLQRVPHSPYGFAALALRRADDDRMAIVHHVMTRPLESLQQRIKETHILLHEGRT